MASLLFTFLSRVFSTAFSATAFSSTNFLFSRFTDHSEEECKRHDLELEKLQRARDEWNKDPIKRLDFITKRLREKMRQGHASIMLMKQCLNTIVYLQNK